MLSLFFVVFFTAIPIYVGTALGHVIASRKCYKYFQMKSGIVVLNACDKLYVSNEDKDILDNCKALPSVTEFGKQCVVIKNEEANKLKEENQSSPSCKGDARDNKRFRWPTPNCMKRACLKDGDKDESKTQVSILQINNYIFL